MFRKMRTVTPFNAKLWSCQPERGSQWARRGLVVGSSWPPLPSQLGLYCQTLELRAACAIHWRVGRAASAAPLFGWPGGNSWSQNIRPRACLRSAFVPEPLTGSPNRSRLARFFDRSVIHVCRRAC